MIKQKNSIKSHQAVVPKGIRVVALEDLSIADKKRKVSSEGFATWIRVLLQNWRQGTVAVKGRSDVARSNKKPWKQKGTGRARAGSARSPLWRGGGVTFGPQRRSKTLSIPKKAKRGIMNALLFNFIEQGRIACLSWSLFGERPQTSQAFKALKEANLHSSKIVLLLSFDDALTYASFSNIPNVKIVFFDQINAYDLANANNWVYLQKDDELFQEMVGRWI